MVGVSVWGHSTECRLTTRSSDSSHFLFRKGGLGKTISTVSCNSAEMWLMGSFIILISSWRFFFRLIDSSVSAAETFSKWVRANNYCYKQRYSSTILLQAVNKNNILDIFLRDVQSFWVWMLKMPEGLCLWRLLVPLIPIDRGPPNIRPHLF